MVVIVVVVVEMSIVAVTYNYGISDSEQLRSSNETVVIIDV